RLNASDSSYGSLDADESEDVFKDPERYLFHAQDDPAWILEKEDTGDQGKEKLLCALEQLDERSQDILQQRWLAENKLTLHDLAKKYGVSAERVRQLEKNAMKKLRQHMEI